MRERKRKKIPYFKTALQYTDYYLTRWGSWAFAYKPVPKDKPGFDYGRRTLAMDPDADDDVAEFVESAVICLPERGRSPDDIDYALKLYYLFSHSHFSGGKVMNMSESMFRKLLNDGQRYMLGFITASVRYRQAPEEVQRSFNWVKRAEVPYGRQARA